MKIPYGRQQISEEDISAVCAVLRSDYLTQGPVVTQFEREVCTVTKARYGIGVNSGSSALHLACLALGLGEGDFLWTSPITFVASANCALHCGAQVDFVDIDKQTGNLCVRALKRKLINAEAAKQLPKILVAVHLAGLSCDMEEICKLGKQYGFHIIEDGCHAIGGDYQSKPVGCCTYSDLCVFSFHPVKTITTGEGGMVVTNNPNLEQKTRTLSSHAITRNSDEMTEKSHGPWYYQQLDLGFNFRMTDIQAALGLSQLKRLSEFNERRRQLSRLYDNLLKNFPLQLPITRTENSNSGLHLYIVRLQLDKINKSHRKVFEEMRAFNIGVNLHYIPVHLQPFYQQMGFKLGDFPEAEQYYQEALTLPLFPAMSEDDVTEVVDTLRRVIDAR